MPPRVIMLCTGTPAPDMAHWGSSFLVGIGDEWLMFDCGHGANYKLHKAGFQSTQIDKMFFTHHHSDHDADYPSFLLTRFDMSIGKESELEVYGPKLTEQLTDRLLGEPNGAYWHDIVARTKHPLSVAAYEERGGIPPRKPPKIHAKDIGPGTVATGKNWEITAATVDHVQPYLDSLAYRIDSDEGSIVFSGDTSPCKSLTDLATRADLLVMECIKVDEDMIPGSPSYDTETGTFGAAQTAVDAGVKRLALVHQQGKMEEPVRKSQALFEVKSVFNGPVIWGEELLEVPWE
ncbi:MAG: MBL fold metallo-hydrolase [Chloroflexi bacterium]|jgi:ribonuclease Z|nr:MBL fold metallo-hydrolase [Chloroflexota bacterium]